MFSCLILSTYLCQNLLFNKVEVPKWDMEETIQALIYCESKGKEFARNDDDGTIGEDSWGILQMKLKTIHWASKRYKIPMRDPLELEFQKELARAMILDGRASTTQGWFNCWRKMKIVL